MTSERKDRLIPVGVLVPFVLVTSLFALWGFANDVTNPMVKAFSRILLMSNFEGSLVQFAFYGGYFVMAFPAALFIKRYSYKAGILVGLGLYAGGALLFLPASWSMAFVPFLIAYFVLTCGLSFLETSANPFILSMGSVETATRRLNLAQAFNPVGSLTGMFVARQFILARLDPSTAAERAALAPADLASLTSSDLAIVRAPYLAIAGVIVVIGILIWRTRMPGAGSAVRRLDVLPTLRRLLADRRYVGGVVAQFFYVGAQITCWTFIIQYGTEVLMQTRGLTESQAEVAAQGYNMAAMIIFLSSRFLCTFALRWVSPGGLLGVLAVAGFGLVTGTILLPGVGGLYSLVGVSACMSLMFPTIYGIALQGIGEDAKLGAAGLIMAILGGSVLPPLQAAVMDGGGMAGLSAVRLSFVVPLLCFLVVAWYGFRTLRMERANS